MKKYKVIFSQSALDDLEEIILYISKDSRQNAMRMHDRIIEVANKLEIFPKLGFQVPDKKMSEGGFRVIVIDKYLLFYKVYDEEINILRVMHGARNYPRLFSKLSPSE